MLSLPVTESKNVIKAKVLRNKKKLNTLNFEGDRKISDK